MYVQSNIPDRYPGRCGCLSFNPATGQNERCLEYANEPHVCRWEKKPMPKPGGTMLPTNPPKYPAWVKPEDRPPTCEACGCELKDGNCWWC